MNELHFIINWQNEFSILENKRLFSLFNSNDTIIYQIKITKIKRIVYYLTSNSLSGCT